MNINIEIEKLKKLIESKDYPEIIIGLKKFIKELLFKEVFPIFHDAGLKLLDNFEFEVSEETFNLHSKTRVSIFFKKDSVGNVYRFSIPIELKNSLLQDVTKDIFIEKIINYCKNKEFEDLKVFLTQVILQTYGEEINREYSKNFNNDDLYEYITEVWKVLISEDVYLLISETPIADFLQREYLLGDKIDYFFVIPFTFYRSIWEEKFNVKERSYDNPRTRKDLIEWIQWFIKIKKLYSEFVRKLYNFQDCTQHIFMDPYTELSHLEKLRNSVQSQKSLRGKELALEKRSLLVNSNVFFDSLFEYFKKRFSANGALLIQRTLIQAIQDDRETFMRHRRKNENEEYLKARNESKKDLSGVAFKLNAFLRKLYILWSENNIIINNKLFLIFAKYEKELEQAQINLKNLKNLQKISKKTEGSLQFTKEILDLKNNIRRLQYALKKQNTQKAFDILCNEIMTSFEKGSQMEIIKLKEQKEVEEGKVIPVAVIWVRFKHGNYDDIAKVWLNLTEYPMLCPPLNWKKPDIKEIENYKTVGAIGGGFLLNYREIFPLIRTNRKTTIDIRNLSQEIINEINSVQGIPIVLNLTNLDYFISIAIKLFEDSKEELMHLQKTKPQKPNMQDKTSEEIKLTYALYRAEKADWISKSDKIIIKFIEIKNILQFFIIALSEGSYTIKVWQSLFLCRAFRLQESGWVNLTQSKIFRWFVAGNVKNKMLTQNSSENVLHKLKYMFYLLGKDHTFRIYDPKKETLNQYLEAYVKVKGHDLWDTAQFMWYQFNLFNEDKQKVVSLCLSYDATGSLFQIYTMKWEPLLGFLCNVTPSTNGEKQDFYGWFIKNITFPDVINYVPVSQEKGGVAEKIIVKEETKEWFKERKNIKTALMSFIYNATILATHSDLYHLPHTLHYSSNEFFGILSFWQKEIFKLLDRIEYIKGLIFIGHLLQKKAGYIPFSLWNSSTQILYRKLVEGEKTVEFEFYVDQKKVTHSGRLRVWSLGGYDHIKFANALFTHLIHSADSEIAVKVINELKKKKIYVKTIHDCFMVDSQYKDILLDTYYKILKDITSRSINWKSIFCINPKDEPNLDCWVKNDFPLDPKMLKPHLDIKKHQRQIYSYRSKIKKLRKIISRLEDLEQKILKEREEEFKKGRSPFILFEG